MKKILFILALAGAAHAFLVKSYQRKKPVPVIPSARTTRAQNMVKLFSGKNKQEKIFAAYGALQGNINALATLNPKIEKTPVSKVILDLQSLCSAAYSRNINVRILGSLSIKELGDSLRALNKKHDNLYQRTFPIQWRHILGFLDMHTYPLCYHSMRPVLKKEAH